MSESDLAKGKAFLEAHWRFLVKPHVNRDLPPETWDGIQHHPLGDGRRAWVDAALAYEESVSPSLPTPGAADA